MLVVRDPPGGTSAQVPGILGMNVLSRCYQELFGQHCTALFDAPSVSGASKPVFQALQHCGQVSAVRQESCMGKVRLRGRSVCRIPGGTIKVVAATCSGHFAGETVLFEPPENGLPAGLLASAALM